MMDISDGRPIRRRINVLTFDGGGVRGLSSLLILEKLMEQINESIKALTYSSGQCLKVMPQDIFDLVAGTSTGGLISLMLGKLGMDVDQCIHEFRVFSEDLFKRRQFLALGGFIRSKYPGSKLNNCVRALLRRRDLDENLQMAFDKGVDKIACTVVCRECANGSRLTSKAVYICSLSCADRVTECLVCEAARATSAAPTYFPVQKIADRDFVDGALQYNNPSHIIFSHYSQPTHVAESGNAPATDSASPIAFAHGALDFRKVRIINLGTGTKVEAYQSNRQSFLVRAVPGARKATFLVNALREIAVDSEYVVDMMRTLAKFRDGTVENDTPIKYERFSADNGLGDIKMDRYKELGEIKIRTEEYLKTPHVQKQLRRLGEEIAREHLQYRYTDIHDGGREVGELATDTPPSRRGTVSSLNTRSDVASSRPTTPPGDQSQSSPSDSLTGSSMNTSFTSSPNSSEKPGNKFLEVPPDTKIYQPKFK